MIMGVPSLNIEVVEVSFGGILLGGGGCLDGRPKRVARSGFLARVAGLLEYKYYGKSPFIQFNC